MARIELAPEIIDDFERILAHLELYQVESAADRVDEIIAAIDILSINPLIGRPCASEKRELVIGKESHGYVALYGYMAELDLVLVLAIRSQREAGYAG